ncbi:MAG: dipicolinate synthase subunit DpsA [Acutalibacteraceae bacterium]
MVNINTFGIIGGDKRQLATARIISADGYTVNLCLFEKLDNLLSDSFDRLPLEEFALFSDTIILPLPLTKDGVTLNAPYSDKKIILNDEFAKLFKGKTVFCPIKEKLIKTSSYWQDVKVYGFLDREEMQVCNAVPTAEGAIEIAMREYEGTINCSKCLITGYGRIGKVLAGMLSGLGAKVYVSARRKESLEWIRLNGFIPINNKDLITSGEFDIIFNTVPAQIIDAHIIAKIATNALIVDLASLPGGVDFESAKRMGIKTIHALSLPGKVAPKTSGGIIKNTIFNILEEENA